MPEKYFYFHSVLAKYTLLRFITLWLKGTSSKLNPTAVLLLLFIILTSAHSQPGKIYIVGTVVAVNLDLITAEKHILPDNNTVFNTDLVTDTAMFGLEEKENQNRTVLDTRLTKKIRLVVKKTTTDKKQQPARVAIASATVPFGSRSADGLFLEARVLLTTSNPTFEYNKKFKTVAVNTKAVYHLTATKKVFFDPFFCVQPSPNKKFNRYFSLPPPIFLV